MLYPITFVSGDGFQSKVTPLAIFAKKKNVAMTQKMDFLKFIATSYRNCFMMSTKLLTYDRAINCQLSWSGLSYSELNRTTDLNWICGCSCISNNIDCCCSCTCSEGEG